MRTSPECLSCLRRQALAAIGLATSDATIHRRTKEKAEAYLNAIDPTLSPPENATGLYALIAQHSGCPDPFVHLKQQENWLALQLREQIRDQIAASSDPLLAGLKYAAAGNIIDHGTNHSFDTRKAMADCLARSFAVNDLEQFRHALHGAKTILYLADNCGEIVLDGLLAELLIPGREVVMAVRGGVIINDATLADAQLCCLTKKLRVISNGCACPGTPLAQCSPEFRRCFQEADLIISKGQGNFETLSETKAPLYFLLTAKCAVVADCLHARTGTAVTIGELILHRTQA